MKNIIFSSVFLLLLLNCKKPEIVCVDQEFETILTLKIFEHKEIVLEHTNDTVNFYFDAVNESRCSNWFFDHDDNCDYLFGSGHIQGHLTINNDTSFLYSPNLNGCNWEAVLPKYPIYYKGIKILFSKLSPYPSDYDNIDYYNYEATLNFYQIREVCN